MDHVFASNTTADSLGFTIFMPAYRTVTSLWSFLFLRVGDLTFDLSGLPLGGLGFPQLKVPPVFFLCVSFVRRPHIVPTSM